MSDPKTPETLREAAAWHDMKAADCQSDADAAERNVNRRDSAEWAEACARDMLDFQRRATLYRLAAAALREQAAGLDRVAQVRARVEAMRTEYKHERVGWLFDKVLAAIDGDGGER